jgi:hypothetical protein
VFVVLLLHCTNELYVALCFCAHSFVIRSHVKKIKKREAKWTEDDNDALYFAWNDQIHLQEALHGISGKQPFDKFWQQIHQRLNKSNTTKEARSLSSLCNRWHTIIMCYNVVARFDQVKKVECNLGNDL